ncbi:MAG: lysophospholipid acyltransferase family protein [Ignavibacteriaceae bacterium]|nr:lysophospholipid acyltransferase family protein [Ignavibacteriaceae bacterium]
MGYRKFKQDFLRVIGLFVLSQAVDLLCKSLKVSYKNREIVDALENQNKNYVLAFWHGQMLLGWYLHRNKNFTALISQSKDGDLLAKLLKHWKYNVVRGSSSKGGDVALGMMVDYAKNNESVVITPDGPRGPANKMKAGAVVIAKKSKVPLILVGVGYKKKRILKSWDRFEVPKFFSGAKVIYSSPVLLKEDLSFSDTSEAILNCEQKLNELQIEANNFDNKT